MGLYDEIVEHAMSVDPTSAPNVPVHRADAIRALEAIGERRAAGERIRGEAMLDLASWAAAGRDSGLTIAAIARCAGVSRVTVYALLDT